VIHYTGGMRNIDLQASISRGLEAIDTRMFESIRDTLEVNRKGRIVPHYPFVPSFTHPEAWGIPPVGQAKVHKKVGKKNSSKRGR
jgi:hypothetical protein